MRCCTMTLRWMVCSWAGHIGSISVLTAHSVNAIVYTAKHCKTTPGPLGCWARWVLKMTTDVCPVVLHCWSIPPCPFMADKDAQGIYNTPWDIHIPAFVHQLLNPTECKALPHYSFPQLYGCVWLIICGQQCHNSISVGLSLPSAKPPFACECFRSPSSSSFYMFHIIWIIWLQMSQEHAATEGRFPNKGEGYICLYLKLWATTGYSRVGQC